MRLLRIADDFLRSIDKRSHTGKFFHLARRLSAAKDRRITPIARDNDRIQLAFREKFAEMGLILAKLHGLFRPLHLHGQIITDEKLVSGHVPFHVGGFQSELVIEQPARPDISGGAVARQPDLLALELGRMAHGSGRNIDVAMTRPAGEKYRQGQKTPAHLVGAQKGRGGKFANVELVLFESMVLLTRRKRIVNDLDAVTFDLDSVVDNRPCARFGRDPYGNCWFFHSMTPILGELKTCRIERCGKHGRAISLTATVHQINFHIVPAGKSLLPLFVKEGLNFAEEKSPFEKGGQEGFERSSAVPC